MSNKNSNMGRPTKYDDTMIGKAKAYLKDYEKVHQHAVPSVAGLAVVLGVARSTLYVWAEEHTDFSDMLEVLNTYQEQALCSGGLKSVFNSTITKLMLHQHGLHDKQDTEHTGSLTVYADSRDEAL